MGLDGVYLVMEVEEHFGVTIKDVEAGGIRTVGDLLDLIEARIVRRETAGCLSLPWFLKLRSLTRDATQQPNFRIRPATEVCAALQPHERKQLWQGLKKYFGDSLRDLRRPRPIRIALGVMALASPILLIGSGAVSSMSLALASAACAAGAVALTLASRPLKSVPPIGYVTFGEITTRLVGLEAVANGYPAKSRDLIFSDLALIVSEQLGVKLEKVTPNARFVQDLGMD